MRQLFCIFSVAAVLILFHNIGISAQAITERNAVDSVARLRNFAGEDAYFIYNNVEMEVFNENSEHKPDEINQLSFANKIRIRYLSRMRLNTRNGVDNYGHIVLTKDKKSVITSFEVTAFKPNGTMIRFDSGQIFHSSIPDLEDSKNNQDLLKYTIPGIEPGDEIEFSYECELQGDITSKLYGNIFLNNYLPIIKSCYRITVPYPYSVIYKCYNGFENPAVQVSGSKVTCTFQLDSLYIIKDLLYASLFDEVPYFYYSIEFNKGMAQSLEWNDLFNNFNFYTSDQGYFYNTDDTEFKKWIRKNLKNSKDRDKFQQFEELYPKIRVNSEKTSRLNQGDPITMLAKELLTISSIYSDCTPYAKLLKYLDIEYYVCFGRNKYFGSIDENFIRKNEISDIFLTYYDNDSNLNIVYPNGKYRKYHLNEVPTYLNGTYAYMIKMDHPARSKGMHDSYKATNESELVIKKILIQKGNENTNYSQRTRNIVIDLKSEEASYQSILNFSGNNSTDYRFFFDEIFQDKEKYKAFLAIMQDDRDIFKVDSVYLKSEQSKSPYKYSVFMSGKLKKFYNYINDSTILISVEEILNNRTIDYDKQYRNLDVVLPYRFTDIQDLIIEFDRPVKIINKEALEKELENSTGSYKFQLMLLGDNKLRLTSTYIIKRENIAKTMLNQLDALNDAVNEMSNSRVIVNIKML
jgi:hypothetical protein